MISITIDGAEEILSRLDAAQRTEILRPPMVRSLARLQADMAAYPAPPSGSTYRRTGDYGRLFTSSVDTDGDDLVGKLGNAVRDRRYGRAYGPYVGDSELQVDVHRGRWTTDEQSVMDNLDAIENDFANSIEGALDGF